MPAENNQEVKEFVDRVEVVPSTDDEIVELPETETPASSSEVKTPADPETPPEGGENKKDQIVSRGTNIENPPKEPIAVEIPKAGESKRLPDETPKEYALRLEIGRLRLKNREKQSNDFFQEPNSQKPEVKTPETKSKVLEKYDPIELANLREVMEAFADDLGFVKKDEIKATTYSSVATQQLDSFLEAHPEYTVEKDPDSLLWNRFKDEYKLYKQPENPKEFSKLFNKIHKDIFNIQPETGLTKIQAQQEKVKVASHAGASAGGPNKNTSTKAKAGNGFNRSMLKGFSEAELDEMEA